MNHSMENKFKRYPAYKDSGVEWLGEIPEGWEVKKIFHLFIGIGSGTTPTAGSNLYYENGKLNWLQTGDLNDSVITKTKKKITRIALKHYSVLKMFKRESLVIAMYGATIGKLGILDIETTTNQACCVLNKINNANMKFYFYSFYGFKRQIVALSYGGGQPNISQDLIKTLKFPFPPLPEQASIANFLDKKTAKIDNAIAQKEKLIALLKEQKQIIIQNAVTKGLNPNVKIKDSGVEWIGEIPEHWDVKKCKYLFFEASEKSEEGKEELLSVSHMTGVTPRSEKEVNMFLAEDYSGSKICRDGDIVYNIMWAWMGALGVSYQKGIVSPAYGVYRMKESDFFNKRFLEYKLKTVEYIEYYNKISTGLHSSRLRFYSHMFMNMELVFPTKKEQNTIVKYIEIQSCKIDKAIDLQGKQIEKLKEYKAILIDNAVTGKIKVC